jgi:hypothetical protein
MLSVTHCCWLSMCAVDSGWQLLSLKPCEVASARIISVQLDKKQISFEAWETFQLHVDKNISSFKSRPTNANGVPLMHFTQLETEQKEFIEKMGSWWSEFHEAVEKGEI